MSGVPFHVFWDWNGTLLDDTRASLAALNVLLARRALPPVTLEAYRARFAFPVRPYYAEVGIRLDAEDWNALAAEYHAAYLAEPQALNPETRAALERVRQLGGRQSIISAMRQDLLDRSVAAYGLTHYFHRISGTDNLDGASKLDNARRLLAELRADPAAAPARVIVIGDAIHDKEVADALGVECVLCAQGGHSAARLRAVAPTGDTVLEALSMALNP